VIDSLLPTVHQGLRGLGQTFARANKEGAKLPLGMAVEAMDAFHQLKDCLVTVPVLASLEPGNDDFLVHSDDSNFAVGAVLSQWQQDSTTGRQQQRVIGFFLRKLIATECKYATYDRELMAIRDALQSWRFFMQGKHVDISMDHRALERILKQRTLSSHQFNTLMDLNHFDYNIRYIPGAKNVVAVTGPDTQGPRTTDSSLITKSNF
jgi:hypothetical protein